MHPGGTEKYVIRILGSLSKEEFRTYIIIDKKEGALLPELIDMVDEVTEIKNQSGFINRIKYLFNTYKFFINNRIDIVQAHNDISIFFIFLSAICARVHTLVYSQRHSGWLQSFKSDNSHGFWPADLKNGIIGFISRNWADYIFVNSNHIKNQLLSDYKVSADKIHVIHNSIKKINLMNETEKINFKDDNNILLDKIVIGVVARLTKIKNISILIEVAKKINKENYFFVVIGDGPEKTNLIKKIKSYKLEHNFKLVGEKNNVLDWVQNFDIAVLPTLIEGFPNSILEYMICAKPVICTDVDGVSEVVVDKRTGLLVSANDKDNLYNAIIKLINNAELRKFMGKNGREHVLKNFHPALEIDNHIKIYENCIV